MKVVSNNIKTALKQPKTTRKGRIKVNGTYYDVYNVKYYADCYDEGNVIGNAIASQLDFDLPYIEKFNKFEYEDGVWTGTKFEYVNLGEFEVFDESDNDKFFQHIVAFDNLIRFNKPFIDKNDYPKTMYQELQNVCQQANIVLLNASIINGNFIIENNQFVAGESLKTVLKEICRANGVYATIKDNKLSLQLKNVTNEALNKSQHEPVEWKRKTYGINQVVLGSSQIEGEYSIREDKADKEKNGVHKLVINDSMFAYTQDKREALIDGIFNQVKGFGYTPFNLKGEWLNYLEVGDTINVEGVETIVLRIDGRSPKSLLSGLSAPAVIDSSIDYIDNTNDTQNKLKKTEIKVDKQNQIIKSVVTNETSQNQKISQIQQTVDELNSKIKDIADITISGETSFGTVDLDNINKSEPISIKIRPTKTNISYLYPRTNLYPSNNLYSKIRKLIFHNKTLNKDTILEIPDDLLYLDSSTYDEMIFDYDSKSLMINKKLAYDNKGNAVKLPKMIIKNYDFPTLLLEEGDYTIYTPTYNDSYIFVRLMAQNIYTTQFATRVEVTSEINQKANEINLSVDQKLVGVEKEFKSEISQTANSINLEVSKKVGKNEVISRINQTPESVTIEANKVDIKGVITAVNNDTTTTINGNKITTGTITSNEIATKTIKADNIDTNAITSDKITAEAITSSKIKSNAITADKVSADIITTKNFNAQKINADNINAGTLTGRAISGGSVSGAKITGGSIAIQKGNYYFNMGTGTNHPNCSGLNVAREINMNGIGFSSDGARFNFSNEITVPYFKAFNRLISSTDSYLHGQVHLNNVTTASDGNITISQPSSSYGLNIRSYCSSAVVGNASQRSIMLAAGNNISMRAIGGHCYAGGNGVSNARIKTDSGSASSRNTKTNFEKFNDLKYKKALNLLKNIDIYSYDYKYNLYENKHQYGFIIDEIEKLKDYQEFFDFRKEKAKVINKDELDFCVEDDDKDTIEVQKYNPDTLDKYLLTCIKAQQQEIEELKQQIKELKNMI